MHSEIIINKNYPLVNPMQFGYEACEKSHSYGPATRLYWLLHFVVSGKGVFHIGGKRYTLTEGMLFVIPPFVETYYEADAEEPWEYIWVGFTGEPPLPLQHTYHLPRARRLFEHMKACHTLHEGKTEFILAKLWELFSLLMEEKDSRTDPVEAAVHLIHAEYMTPLTVEQIAARLHLERTYFSKIFQRRLGVSPKRYLLNHRMEQAVELLRRGYSVSVTAVSVGYSDVYTFSKMFKRHFGSSPQRYRALPPTP